MRNKSKEPVIISADVALFGFLEERVGERKTRTEAYCDLLDKASAGYVTPFLKNRECELQPCQCHVTITDLAGQWNWHRATIRAFIERLEEYGQLETLKLPKSIVITMPVNAIKPDGNNDRCNPSFDKNLDGILSDWVSGKCPLMETSEAIGQLACKEQERIAEMNKEDCTHMEIPKGKTVADHIRQTVLASIAGAALWKVLCGYHGKDTSLLSEFFKEDLGGDWASFMEAAKVLAELVIEGKSSSLEAEPSGIRNHFQTLRIPFKALLAEHQRQNRDVCSR